MTETLTITRALSELKLLDKRIAKKVTECTFTSVISKKNKHLVNQDQFSSNAKEDYQSIDDLIKRYNKIKSAIILSNSVTDVKLGNDVLTVAEVIERKQSLHYKKRLLEQLKRNRELSNTTMQHSNQQMEGDLQRLLETSFGKTSNNKTNADDIENISKAFRESNQSRVLDPIGVDVKITELEKEIDEYDREANFVLSESNALTKIAL
jgi:hypoxanthine phosphoribosyltransferase